MTKTDLIEVVARKRKLSQSDASHAVNAFMETIADALKKGDKVTLKDFVTFDPAEMAPEPATKPQPSKKTAAGTAERAKPEKTGIKPAAKPQPSKKTAAGTVSRVKAEKTSVKPAAKPQLSKKIEAGTVKRVKPGKTDIKPAAKSEPLEKTATDTARRVTPAETNIKPVVTSEPLKKIETDAVNRVTQEKATKDVVKNQSRKEEHHVLTLGSRYKCYKCGTKFYDLGRQQPICPSCEANQNDDEAKGVHKRKKRRRPYPMVKAEPTITAPEEIEYLDETAQEIDGEYTLDMEDIVLEGYEETGKSE